jgi:hypothetical protein
VYLDSVEKDLKITDIRNWRRRRRRRRTAFCAILMEFLP